MKFAVVPFVLLLAACSRSEPDKPVSVTGKTPEPKKEDRFIYARISGFSKTDSGAT